MNWRVMMLVAVLSGCAAGGSATKEVRLPPSTPEGEQCVKECRSQQAECRRMGQRAYRYCRQQYRQQEYYYKECQRRRAGFCTRPQTCQSPNTTVCTERFNQCFEFCGGAIESVPNPEG